MRENLSAPGTVEEWLQTAHQALRNLDYYNITQDPTYARLSARYGYDDYIIVNIRNKTNNRVLLEFEVSSPKMVQQFKTGSVQVIRQRQEAYKRRQEEKMYGPDPETIYVPDFPPEERMEKLQQTVEQNLSNLQEPEERTPPEPEYVAEEGDYIERTRYLPDDTLVLRKYQEILEGSEGTSGRKSEEDFKKKFKKIFDKTWLIMLLIVLLPPFGIYLLWHFHRFKVIPRILLSVLGFFYFALIWIGFLGIDTGFNRETIQKFYDSQQYKVTRYFNELDNKAGLNDPANQINDPNLQLEGTGTYTPQSPISQAPAAAPAEEKGFLDKIDDFIDNFFSR